jgi:hypothetical protein
MLEAHHRRGDRTAAFALDRHQSERTRRRSPRAFISPASWFSGRTTADQAAAIASSTMCVIAISTATRRAARSTVNPIWNSDFKMDMSVSHRRQGRDAHENKPGRDDQIRPQNEQPGPVEGGQMPRRQVGERRHSPGIAQ